MLDIDLQALSLKELKGLQKDLEKTIFSYEDRQKSEALAVLEESARSLGFTLSELLNGGEKLKKTRAPATAKYRHPENPDITWSGRGRRPLWISNGLLAGKSHTDFAI